MSLTLNEGKKETEGTGSGEKEETIKKRARGLLCRLIGRQWILVIIGFPFLFLATINDMFVPDYVGKIVDAFTEENYEGKDGVFERLREWMLILFVGVTCTFLQKMIFGLTGERIGNDLRLTLFKSIIGKDISFFDTFRTGEILSRISSDT